MKEDPQNKNPLTILRFVGLLIGLGFLAYQLYSAREVLISYLKGTLSVHSFFLSLIIILLAIMLQITVWHVLVKFFDVDVPYSKTLLGYTLAFLPKYIPGTIWGYLNRNEWLYSEFNVPRKTSMTILVIETVFISGSIIFILIAYLSKINLVLLSVAYIAILLLEYLFFVALRRQSVLKMFYSNQLKPISIWKVLLAHSTYIFVWFIYGLALFLLTTTIQMPINWLVLFKSIVQFGIAFGISWSIGFILFIIPSGIGVREHTLAIFLKRINLSQTSMSTSTSLVFRLLVSLGELLLAFVGIIYKAFYRIRNPNKF